MVTYFVIYNAGTKEFAKAGRFPAITYSLNSAKHFTSEWSAKNYLAEHDLFVGSTIKRIERY